MTGAERVWNAYIDAWSTHSTDAIVAAVDEHFIYDEQAIDDGSSERLRSMRV